MLVDFCLQLRQQQPLFIYIYYIICMCICIYIYIHMIYIYTKYICMKVNIMKDSIYKLLAHRLGHAPMFDLLFAEA